MALNDCKIIELPKISYRVVTFPLLRVGGIYHLIYNAFITSTMFPVDQIWVYAHKNLHQFIVAMSGSFDVVLDDGYEKQRFHLNRSYYGLYVCPMMWRYLDNFSSGAVCMVLALADYDEFEYIRDYEQFVLAIQSNKRKEPC